MMASPDAGAGPGAELAFPFLASGGCMGVLFRGFDWAATPLGPVEEWPQSLRTAVCLMLHARQPMFIAWGPELTFLYNDDYRPVLGSKDPDALGKPFQTVWSDIWAQFGPLVQQVMGGEALSFEDLPIPMQRNGYLEETFFSFSYTPIHDEGGRIVGIFCACTETTSKVRGERALRANEAQLEALVTARTAERNRIWQVSRDMLLVTDQDGTWLSANPSWTRVLGWEEHELLGRVSEWLEHPQDREKTRLERARLTAGKESAAFENRLRRRDGTYRVLSWTAVPAEDRIYCVARDVTEERSRDATLFLYEHIIQSDVAPICAFDTEYRLIAFNKAHSDEFFRIYGYRVRVGDVFPDLFLPEQAPTMRALMKRALTGEIFRVVEEFGDPALAKPYWEVSYSPLRDENGQIIGAFHHAQDISARLRAEGELARTQEALRQAQKMELVGQLTGGVAHDFNNLLTVIKSSTDLLKRPGLSDLRRDRYVAAISDTVDRASKLTGQLLAFARRQALRPEVFDAVESVRSMGDMMGTLTGSRVTVTTQLADEPCFVNADPSQFDTALVNMAVNARDAMDGEGHLAIRLRPVNELPAIRSHPARQGSFIAVSLTDTGAGIPPEHRERIFEPFFTTKGVGQGTGLGLSQVYGFAKQSEGEIMVSSEVGRGTTFTLYLPRVSIDAVKPDSEVEPEPLMDGHGTCVLVVEDNPGVGTFATQTLTELGYVSVWAANAEEALAELEKDADRFDVVFSDVIMPGMNGIELGQKIRQEYLDLPVVLTSGYSHVLAQNGTYGFELLHKPYSIEQLSRVLRKAATWQRRRRIIGAAEE
ncbi:PAS domain-containing protein [Roseomonas sp. WA12]